MRRFCVQFACSLLLVVGSGAQATEGPSAEPPVGPEQHPQLSPLGYQLSAQKEQALAARRQSIKTQRLKELSARLQDAQTRADEGLSTQLEAVIKRVEAGAPPTIERTNAWGSEHMAHMRALDQWHKYGAQLDKPDVVQAFDKHALRMAKLLRIREVTSSMTPSTEREALLSQIETTIELEGARHVEQLERWLTPNKGATP